MTRSSDGFVFILHTTNLDVDSDVLVAAAAKIARRGEFEAESGQIKNEWIDSAI